MTELKKFKFIVEILYNMFYNTNNDFKMGEFVVSPILLFQLLEIHLPKLVKPSVFDATVIIAGISIVIGVLLLLILIFNIFGKMVPKIEVASKKHEEKKAARKAARKAKKEAKKVDRMPEKATEPVAEAPKTAPVVKAAPAPAPVVEQGISGEVVAAITAAIVATEGSDVVVRSIRKKNVSGRNPWAQAANIDNTRPF